MIGVRVKTYEATTPNEQSELLRLTIEELVNPIFPPQINVLISQPGASLIVMSIEPHDIDWEWPGEKTEKETVKEGFGRFKKPTRFFIARRL